MSSPVRTVIGHGRILAHPNLPVETSETSSWTIDTGVGAGSFNAGRNFFLRAVRAGFTGAVRVGSYRAGRTGRSRGPPPVPGDP
ncbi:hypothetical protein GA0115253_1067010, partial [Streptomyces sp. Termitarium-T10T-6]